MGILNPKLLSTDLKLVLDEASRLRNRYRQPQIVPATILLAIIRQQNNAATSSIGITDTKWCN